MSRVGAGGGHDPDALKGVLRAVELLHSPAPDSEGQLLALLLKSRPGGGAEGKGDPQPPGSARPPPPSRRPCSSTDGEPALALVTANLQGGGQPPGGDGSKALGEPSSPGKLPLGAPRGVTKPRAQIKSKLEAIRK